MLFRSRKKNRDERAIGRVSHGAASVARCVLGDPRAHERCRLGRPVRSQPSHPPVPLPAMSVSYVLDPALQPSRDPTPSAPRGPADARPAPRSPFSEACPIYAPFFGAMVRRSRLPAHRLGGLVDPRASGECAVTTSPTTIPASSSLTRCLAYPRAAPPRSSSPVSPLSVVLPQLPERRARRDPSAR